jgi:hypothetical protein
VPLPTLSVGRVPVSPSVQFTVALRCDLRFGGPLAAEAGVDATSFVRLGAVYEQGVWADPIASEFSITPTFAMSRGSKAFARCALETSAELFAYGVGGVTMQVAPYVDIDVFERSNSELVSPEVRYHVEAGARGTMRGRADVFGVAPGDLERHLVDWKSPDALEGTTSP